MRLLIDPCLHESLVGLAHAAGFEATHVNYLGLKGQPDWALAERITPTLQRALFQAALEYSAGKNLMNSVVE
jgi:hypothetical protein